MTQGSDLRICLIHPNPGPTCETFIQAHVDRLPGVVEVLHGGHMPFFRRDGSSLLTDREETTLVTGTDGQGFSPEGVLRNPSHELRSRALSRLLQERAIDVVLAEYGPTGVAVMHACRTANVSLVVHFHGFDASLKPVLEKYRQGYARLFNKAQMVIAVSRRMEADLLTMGVPRERLHYNVYGVDTDFFQATAPEENEPLFVAVGRFVDKKAPHLTLLAFSRALKKCPEARLVMLGDGPLRETCRSLARALGVDHAVDMPGDRPQREVAELLGRARAFVQHSVTPANGDREGTPNAVMEAGASGLPVITTRHAGIPEVVLENETGLLCEENDVRSFSQNILQLAREPATAARLGTMARAHITASYTMNKSIAVLSRILRQATSRYS